MDPLAASETGSVVAEGAATNRVVQTPNVSTFENTEFNDTRLEAIDPIAGGSADGAGVVHFHKADGTGASTSQAPPTRPISMCTPEYHGEHRGVTLAAAIAEIRNPGEHCYDVGAHVVSVCFKISLFVPFFNIFLSYNETSFMHFFIVPSCEFCY